MLRCSGARWSGTLMHPGVANLRRVHGRVAAAAWPPRGMRRQRRARRQERAHRHGAAQRNPTVVRSAPVSAVWRGPGYQYHILRVVPPGAVLRALSVSKTLYLSPLGKR
ncbi:MAG: hypothetical protein M3256_22990 [Actinomycetota bacterium]|nr:hypothetical protein [Actinomycetota bacterium]